MKIVKSSFILILALIVNIQACYGVLGTDQIKSRGELVEYTPPSQRFNKYNPFQSIDLLLNKLKATNANKDQFKKMMANEIPGFFGYHGSTIDFRIFQDIIRIAIEEYLNIPIRSDFQFLRIPDSPELFYTSKDDFIAHYPFYDDQDVFIQPYLLSLNIALYYSWSFEYDFTPRYFLQNTSSKKPKFQEKLEPFFKKFGMGRLEIDGIFETARAYLPRGNGIILQFFDMSHEKGSSPYVFMNAQAFEGNRFGAHPTKKQLSSYFLFSKKDVQANTNPFWQPKLGNYGSTHNPNAIRLLMSNKQSLNPNSPLIILRYHSLDPSVEAQYEKALREYMRALPVDQDLAYGFRQKLLNLWKK